MAISPLSEDDGHAARPGVENIFAAARKNDAFRRVLCTGSSSQVVLMTIPVGQDIGMEVHKVDQTLVFVDGKATAILNGESAPVGIGSIAFVPKGTQHNFVNAGQVPLRLFTIYAPPNEVPGIVQETKPTKD